MANLDYFMFCFVNSRNTYFISSHPSIGNNRTPQTASCLSEARHILYNLMLFEIVLFFKLIEGDVNLNPVEPLVSMVRQMI